jgi:hypothetical protein
MWGQAKRTHEHARPGLRRIKVYLTLSSAADPSSLNRTLPASTDGSGGQLRLKQNALLGTEREDDTS